MAKPTEVEDLGPDTPVDKAGQRLIKARLDDVRRQMRGLGATADPDAVHDTRVASRRLRVALQLFDGKQLVKLEQRVKELQDALGQVRELQVALKWLKSLKTGSRTKAIGQLEIQLTVELRNKKPTLSKALRTWRRKTAPAIEDAIRKVKGGGRLGGKRLRRHLVARLEKLEDRLAVLKKTLSPERVHALRIDVKRLRYEAELLQPAFPGQADAILKLAANLQEKTGALHDVDVHIALLSEFLARGQSVPPEQLLPVLEKTEVERRRLAGDLRSSVERSRRAVRKVKALFQR